MKNDNTKLRVYHRDGSYSNIMIKHLEGYIEGLKDYIDFEKTIKSFDNFKRNKDEYNNTLNKVYNKLK